ncbi:MAG: DEAD/DEAH box helicase, partial [Caldilineaceae bacterium]|nr:DEAD/DEAH box helicase [Caldilineaceae bacterium]
MADVDTAPRIVAELRCEQHSLEGHARIVSRTVIRLALAYLDFRNAAPQAERRTGPGDLVALLRQLIRLLGGGCTVPASLWHSLRDHAEAAGLIGEVRSDDAIHIYANPWRADWLDHSERVDELAPRSLGDDCVADGMLYAMSRDSGVPWTTYRSAAQKAAVDCWFHAPPGSTTLVTLPTGSGKSMCTLLPAWFDSRGGRRSRESTLVIVPTVALALDQEQQAARFFAYARGEQALPTARIGDTPAQARATIEAAIRDGQMPVIFTSPESLLTSHLYDAVLYAAQR